jgi:SulP family sulfate permease
MFPSNLLDNLKLNWKSGLTVSLVSLPLSIALSIGSGANPVAGIVTSVWAGLIATIFGGSKFNIVGVAGALTSILSSVAILQVLNQGDLKGAFFFPILAIFSGLITLLVYALKLERYLIYIPSSVVHGFAAGVAILIAMGQINDALGLNVEKHPEFFEKIRQTFSNLQGTQISSFSIFLFGIIVLILFKTYIKKIPGVIPVAFFGVILGYVIKTTNLLPFFNNVTSLEQSLTGNDLTAKLFISPNTASWLALINSSSIFFQLLSSAFVIALVSILETLITAKLADKISKQKSNPRQEVLALGLANLGSGIMGGLPASGVFIRSGLNVKSGATGKSSGVINAILSGFLAIFLLPYFKYLPMPILAAILFNTAIGLLEIRHFTHYFTHDKKSFIVSLLVMFFTIFADASLGILIGTSLAMLLFVDRLSKGEFEVRFNRNNKIVGSNHGSSLKCVAGADVVVYSIEGIMVYLDAPAHVDNLQKISNMPKIKTVIIRLRDLFYLDNDGVEMLEETIVDLKSKGKNVILTKPSEDILKEMFRESEIIRGLHDQNKIANKTADALMMIGFKKEDIGAVEAEKNFA